MTADGQSLPKMAVGADGGTAECGGDKSGYESYVWVTGTTTGFPVVEPRGAEPQSSLDGTMIWTRTNLERSSS